jgi:hypothetical protein
VVAVDLQISVPVDQLVITTSSCGFPKMAVSANTLAFPHAQYTSNQMPAVFTEQVNKLDLNKIICTFLRSVHAGITMGTD